MQYREKHRCSLHYLATLAPSDWKGFKILWQWAVLGGGPACAVVHRPFCTGSHRTHFCRALLECVHNDPTDSTGVYTVPITAATVVTALAWPSSTVDSPSASRLWL